MRTISINIEDGPPSVSGDVWLLMPRPINDWHCRFVGYEISGTSELHEITAHNSTQSAYLAKPASSVEAPRIIYHFEDAVSEPPDWFWQLQQNRYTQPSAQLIELATSLGKGCSNQTETINTLMRHAADIFGYGHQDKRFNDNLDKVPTICGTAKGSCIDINTYLIAAATSLDIPVQYIAGYWFHPDKTETHDMHCWLAFKLDGETVFWDLAHHLKWGIQELGPGLNPAGGRRLPMSCGRGLIFDTPLGEVEVSHFSEPIWIHSRAMMTKPELRIQIHQHTER